MKSTYFDYCIYPDDVFDNKFKILPAIVLHDILETYFVIDTITYHSLLTKLEQSSRKLSMMWYASKKAKLVESQFYSSTVKEAPMLFGEDAIKVHYHLEAMVLFARSAMDIASTAFGHTLPDPFKRKRYDSFNDLVKEITKHKDLELYEYFNNLRKDKTSWLSAIADLENGRSIRDKIVHQTSFPIDYTELNPNSEKRQAIVIFNKEKVPLEDFINSLCFGVVEGFLEIEKYSVKHIEEHNKSTETYEN